MCPSAMKGLAGAKYVCAVAWSSQKAQQAGSEQLRLETVRMFLLLLFGGDTIHSLFSAVKTCTEALQNICWCY